LDRVIRVRKILKKNIERTNEYMGVEEMETFNKLRKDDDINFIKSLSRIGIPTFMKKKFKKSTTEKYRIANGKYFGVLV
jgi:hypothetical protein